MVDSNDDAQSRPPTLEDLIQLCKNLNEEKVKYIVIGGMAMIQQGFVRATEDIDLLVDTSLENEDKLRAAMSYLPDRAVLEIAPGELEQYGVIRVADEIVVDLMKSACGVAFGDAVPEIQWAEIQSVRIPFASATLLWKMKQSVRGKDALDREFLKSVLERK